MIQQEQQQNTNVSGSNRMGCGCLTVILIISVILAYFVYYSENSATSYELSKIKVTTYPNYFVFTSDRRYEVLVIAENTSSKTFTGKIEVCSYDIDGSLLDSTILEVKDLGPGKKARGEAYLKIGYMETNIKGEATGGKFK